MHVAARGKRSPREAPCQKIASGSPRAQHVVQTNKKLQKKLAAKFLIKVLGTSVIAIVALGGARLRGRSSPAFRLAHQEPPAAEVVVATWLLHQSVPDGARNAANPLKDDLASVAAGRDLYRDKCETCHAYDGGGRTTIGAGQYPRPPALRSFAI